MGLIGESGLPQQMLANISESRSNHSAIEQGTRQLSEGIVDGYILPAIQETQSSRRTNYRFSA